jgi:hypothetical protein
MQRGESERVLPTVTMEDELTFSVGGRGVSNEAMEPILTVECV